MYANMKNYENIYNCLRVIQQNKNRQLLAADLLKWMKGRRKADLNWACEINYSKPCDNVQLQKFFFRAAHVILLLT